MTAAPVREGMDMSPNMRGLVSVRQAILEADKQGASARWVWLWSSPAGAAHLRRAFFDLSAGAEASVSAACTLKNHLFPARDTAAAGRQRPRQQDCLGNENPVDLVGRLHGHFARREMA